MTARFQTYVDDEHFEGCGNPDHEWREVGVNHRDGLMTWECNGDHDEQPATTPEGN